MQRFTLPVLAAAAISCATTAVIAQSGFTFEKIADTETRIPGDDDSFSLFMSSQADSGTISFVAMGPNGQWGLYADDADGLRIVADHNTPAPDGGTFSSFVQPGASNGRHSFFAGTTIGQSALYVTADSGFKKVAGRSTQIPGRDENFSTFYWQHLRGSNVVFTGGSTTYRGAFLYDSTLHILADTETNVPGSDALFTGIGTITSMGSGALFRADTSDRRRGIYYADLTSISTIVDTNDRAPGSDQPFSRFGIAIADGDDILFSAYSGGGLGGIYMHDGEQIHIIADTNTPVPGGSGVFSGISSSFDADSGRVVFAASESNGGGGVYLAANDHIYRVLASGMMIDGRVVQGFHLGYYPPFLDGDTIPLTIHFTDGLSAIYKITIPSPATFFLLTAIPLTRRRRSH